MNGSQPEAAGLVVYSRNIVDRATVPRSIDHQLMADLRIRPRERTTANKSTSITQKSAANNAQPRMMRRGHPNRCSRTQI
jgi:hypothetical protein